MSIVYERKVNASGDTRIFRLKRRCNVSCKVSRVVEMTNFFVFICSRKLNVLSYGYNMYNVPLYCDKFIIAINLCNKTIGL